MATPPVVATRTAPRTAWLPCRSRSTGFPTAMCRASARPLWRSGSTITAHQTPPSPARYVPRVEGQVPAKSSLRVLLQLQPPIQPPIQAARPDPMLHLCYHPHPDAVPAAKCGWISLVIRYCTALLHGFSAWSGRLGRGCVLYGGGVGASIELL